MPRKPSIPAYRLHKPSGRAKVKIGQRIIYLGKYGTDESREAYAKVLADFLSGRTIEPPKPTSLGVITPKLIIGVVVAR